MKRSITVLAALLVFVLLLGACAKSDPLADTSWELYSYGDIRPLEGTTTTLAFEEGQAGGSSGCNVYSGTYVVKGSKLTFGSTAVTMMMCMEPEGVMEQETDYLQWLAAAQKFALKDGNLLIYRADGTVLTFVPADAQ